MSITSNVYTVLIRCRDCTWERLTRTVSKGIVIKELTDIHFCPNCQGRDLSFHSMRGQYKLEDFKAEAICEYEAN